MEATLNDRITQFENGELDKQQTIELFQYLIDNDLLWAMSDFYQKAARDLMRLGLCHEHATV